MMDFVSWDDEFPSIWKNKKCSKPPTRGKITNLTIERSVFKLEKANYRPRIGSARPTQLARQLLSSGQLYIYHISNYPPDNREICQVVMGNMVRQRCSSTTLFLMRPANLAGFNSRKNISILLIESSEIPIFLG
jgi:hypothetical protein